MVPDECEYRFSSNDDWSDVEGCDDMRCDWDERAVGGMAGNGFKGAGKGLLPITETAEAADDERRWRLDVTDALRAEWGAPLPAPPLLEDGRRGTSGPL